MQNDKITLKDLSIFTAGNGGGVFELLDHTTTLAGKEALRKHIYHPPDSYEQLQEMQDVIKFWADNTDAWPGMITNGTLVMLEKFFEAADSVAQPPTGIALVMGKFLQKVLNKSDYFFAQFSLSHLSDFLKGCSQLTEILKQDNTPALLQRELTVMAEELSHRLTGDIINITKHTPYNDLATLGFKARREMKNMVYRLVDQYARLDAWQSMAKATRQNKWTFPQLVHAQPLHFECAGLYHPLLQQPVSYSTAFGNGKNLLLLTGANMSGKTTYMRSLGVGALLAHLGMGVPAETMKISFLQGIITNMHVEDDLLKGESYFFAEVKRMKHTAEKLKQPQPHLVLMDELFKGTNVHDAYECTRAIVEGLLNRPHHIMILSTHLYEVAQHFNHRSNISFAYFETQMGENESYHFSYKLKEGISNDRIGYRILQKEGVLDLLK
jgi:DNA mismatch repair ATPase MutS